VTCNYAVSIEGIQKAERNLEKAAQKIAKFHPLNETPREPGADQDSISLSGDVDLNAALLESMQARTDAKASMKMISTGQELDETSLDMVG
jgi:hypothetical protein